MDAIRQELKSRQKEIEGALQLLFKTNMKITDWDVPEADNKEAAMILLDILQAKLDTIREDVLAGKYNNY
ncbi:hypothetical protein [Sulfurimonas sp. HSL3-7]|uniref:hypothetical protein n=1 Tax=Sulfonitrofixus jiaomeiensis TaxID=3131938 RepID=UPI0031F83B48